MHYQLFIPDTTSPDPAILDAVGLADLRQGAELLPTAEGPGGRKGLIVAWRKPGKAQIGYQPAKQTWFANATQGDVETGAYWIGLWNDSPLLPATIRRDYPKPGNTVTLGDNQEWTIPIAKELPADIILQDDGSFRFDVQRQYHAFYLEYLTWLEKFAQCREGDQFDFGQAAHFVLAGLRINYRLLPEVASRLKLLNTENVTTAMFAIMNPGK